MVRIIRVMVMMVPWFSLAGVPLLSYVRYAMKVQYYEGRREIIEAYEKRRTHTTH